MDSSFELFAEDLFRNLLHRYGLVSFVPPRPKKFKNCGKSKYDFVICDAVVYRGSFYYYDLIEEIHEDYQKYSKSAVDFYMYLQTKSSKYMPYENLNIFDKLLMTCCITMHLIWACHKNNKNPKRFAPSCWAMYFEFNYKDEFYAAGGWNKLLTYAESYQAYVLRMSIFNVQNTGSDFQRAELIFQNILCDISLPLLLSDFNARVAEGKISCLKHLPLFYVFEKLSFSEVRHEVLKTHLIEGYLQFFLFTFTSEEIKNTTRDLLKKGQFELIRKHIEHDWDLGWNLCSNERSQTEISFEIEDVKAFDEKYSSFTKELKNLLTNKLRKRIFIDDSKLNDTDEQCLFCGEMLNVSLEAVKPTNVHLVKKIESVIQETVVSMRSVESESTSSLKHLGNKKLNSRKETADLNDTLKLFLTLGSQFRTCEGASTIKKLNK